MTDLWGENQPLNAVATIRNYVRRLRSILPTGVLATAPSGYLLAVSEDAVDIYKFLSIANEARRARSTVLFGRALELWRGEPLADLNDVPVKYSVAASWTEVYLGVVEDHTDLRLAHAEHAELVPELIELAGAYPFRHRLSLQLMTALHRCGRSAEAIEFYRRLRETMSAELGVEPDRELQILERSIRDGSSYFSICTEGQGQSRLCKPATSVARASQSTTPCDTKARAAGDELATTDFVGRRDEIKDLMDRFGDSERRLSSSPVRSFIFGQGGSGKSAFALRVADLVAKWYPGGIVHLDVGGSTPGARLLSQIDVVRRLVSLLEGDEPEAKLAADELTSRYVSALVGSRTIILLDNAASYSQISIATCVPRGCAVITTSRAPIQGENVSPAELMHLDAMDDDDAIELMARFVGRRRIRVEGSEAHAIAALCGRLPLALRIVGCRMARQPYWSLAQWQKLLADERHRLDHLNQDGADVRASLLIGLAGLNSGDPVDADALRLFPLLGLVTTPYVTAALGSALTGWSVMRSAAALERLSTAQLMFSLAVDRCAFFDLVSLLAREHAADLDPVLGAATLSSAAEWFLAAARRCSAAATGWVTEPGLPLRHHVDRHHVPRIGSWQEARDWLDREFPVLVQVVTCAARAGVSGIGSLVVDLLPTLPYYVNNARVWNQRVLLAKIALTASGGSLAAGYRELAVVEAQRGDVRRAQDLIQQARAAVSEDSSYHDLSVMLTEGTILGAASRLDAAAAHLARTSEKAAVSGYRRLAIIAEHNRANVLRLQGRTEEALELYHKTYRDSLEIHDFRCAAGDVTGMLLCYAALGRHHDVIALSADLAAPLREPGVSLNRVEQLLTIAVSMRQIGDRLGSAKHVDEAMQYLASIGQRERAQPEHLLAQIEGEISLEQ